MGHASTKTRYVTMLAIGAALGGFLFGSDTSMLNGAITGFTRTLGLSRGSVGFVTAISLIGCAVGAWFSGPITARLGRTRVMSLGAALIGSGALMAALAQHFVVLGLSRFAIGLGIGSLSVAVPGYITEIAPVAIRGRLGSLWQLALVIGQVIGMLGSFGLTLWAGSEAAELPMGGSAWRWMFGSVAFVAAIYIVISWRLTRTPRELVRIGEKDQAKSLLNQLGESNIAKEISAIEASLKKEEQDRKRGLGRLRGPMLGLKPVVWTGILLAAFQQLVGINVVKTYSNALWQSVGLSAEWSFTTSIFTVLLSLVATIIAILIIDRLGRRTMLAAGAAVMAFSLGTMAWAFSTTAAVDEAMVIGRTAGLTAMGAMFVFSLAFGVTWGPVMWVVINEIFEGDIRTSAVAVCVAVNWITNWLVTRTFPLLAGLGLGFAYGLYTAFAVLALVFVLKVLPETRNRVLS